MRAVLTIAVIILTALEVAASLTMSGALPAGIGKLWPPGLSGIHGGMILHASVSGACGLLALLCIRPASLATRGTVALLCTILAVVLPVAGVPAAGALLLTVARPPAVQDRPEERYVFGNPATAAVVPLSSVELRPLATAVREMDDASLAAVLRGLRALSPPRRIRPLLERFTADPNAAVQIAAHSVMATAIEELEAQFQLLKARAANDSDDAVARLDAAEVLFTLIEWLPPGDAAVLIHAAEARPLLEQAADLAPGDPRVVTLTARLHLLHDDPAAALSALETLPPDDPSSAWLRMECHCASGHWNEVIHGAANLVTSEPEQSQSLAFWLAQTPNHTRRGDFEYKRVPLITSSVPPEARSFRPAEGTA